jgi:hypothetical protein
MQSAFDFAYSAPPKSTPSFQYTPSTLAEHLRSFESSDAAASYILQGHRGDGSVAHAKIKSVDLNAHAVVDAMARLAESGCTDLYMTPQAFKGWRNKNLTWSINALHIEIDTEKHHIKDESGAKAVFKQVVSALKKAKLPEPNHIVKSGSGGLHLYWFINPVAAYTHVKKTWETLARAMTDRLGTKIPKNAKWHIDLGASHDMTRLMRLPNSVHSKSGNRVEVLSANVPPYSLDMLCQHLAAKPEKRKEVQQSLPLEPKKTYRGVSNYNTYHSAVVWHIGSYVRQYGVKEGQRDWVLFLAFCSMLQVMDSDKAWSQIRELNKHVGLSDTQLENYMQSAAQKRYIYSKVKLNSILNSLGIPMLPPSRQAMEPEARKQAQSNGAKKAAIVKRQNSISKVADVLITTPNATKAGVVEATGLSLSTVKRCWSEAMTIANEHARALRNGSLGFAQYNPPPKGESEEHLKDVPKIEGFSPVPLSGTYFTEENLELFDSLDTDEDIVLYELDKVQSVVDSSG